MKLRRAAGYLLLVALLAPAAAQAQSVNIDLGAAGQAGATGRGQLARWPPIR